MSIQQSKKQSDLEKRLQLLRRQVYGKNKNQSSAISYQLSDKKQDKSDDRRLMTESYSVSDLSYLHQDLLKILIFASFAIGGQTILFLLVKNNVFTLDFF